MQTHTPELRLRGSETGSRRQPLLRPAVLRRTQSNTSLRVATNLSLSTPSSPAFPIDDPFASFQQQPSTPQPQQPTISFPLSPVDLAALPPVGISLPRRKWKPDSDAPVCDARSCALLFSLLNRRHHCRACGGVFCHRCAPHMVPLLSSGRNAPTLERICDGCFSILVLHNSDNNTSYSNCSSDAITSPLSNIAPAHAAFAAGGAVTPPSMNSSRVFSATAPVTPAASPPYPGPEMVPALFHRAKQQLKSSSNTFPRLVPSNTNCGNDPSVRNTAPYRSSDSDSTSPALSPRSDDRSQPTSSLDTTPPASSSASSPTRKYPSPDAVDLLPPNSTVSVRFPSAVDSHHSTPNTVNMVLDPTKGALPCRINQIYLETEDGNNIAASIDNAPAGSLTYHWSTF